MALENVPPIWKSWRKEDLKGLSRKEMELLQLFLANKLNFVTDQYERYLFQDQRQMYMQLKELQMREEGENSTVRDDYKALFRKR